MHLLDIKQAAPLLGISEHGLRELCKARKIKHLRIGPKRWLYRFRPEWIDEYLDASVVEVETQASRHTDKPMSFKLLAKG